MAQVVRLLDGSNHTFLSEKDAFDLVEKHMGSEMVEYLRDLIEETALLVQDASDESYEDLEEKYETLKEQYEALKEQYDDLRYERGW